MGNREHSLLCRFFHAARAAFPPEPHLLQLLSLPGAVLQLCPGAGTCGNLLLLLQEGSLERHCKDTQAPLISMCEEKALQALSTGLSVLIPEKNAFPTLVPVPSCHSSLLL